MPYVKMCKQCADAHKDDIHNGYYEFIRDDIYVCPICNSKLIDTTITGDEYLAIISIFNDNSFILSMIKLKQDDIIEFQSRMSQFKIQIQQQQQIKEKQNSSTSSLPKCPTCQSTNIEKISLTKKAVGGALFGLFSSDVRKTMHCKNCGAKW